MSSLHPVETVSKEKFKSQMEDLEEHYDKHLNEKLPEFLHRGDIVGTNRLLGYADAMMATCATFLVIPLRNLKEMEEHQSLSGFINENRAEFVMFFLGFLVVLTIWESINVRSIVIKRLDDFLVLFSIFNMLLAAVLPFSLSIQGHYPDEQVAIVTTCVVLLLLEIVELAVLFYAFATPRVLHMATHHWSKQGLKYFRNTLCIKPVVNSIIIIIGGLLSLLHYVATWIFISLIILMPLIRKFILLLRRRNKKQTEIEKCHFFWYFTRGNISKERIECMSDAAVAIIACILILDITVEEFPSEEKVKAHGLSKELKHMSTEFIVFLGCYTTVSMLWYINHTVLHLYHTLNVVLLYFQKLFLAFACLSPLGSNMLFKFASKNNDDTKLAVRVTASFVLVSCIFNCLILAWGFHTKEKYLHKWAVGKCWRSNLRQHLYVVLKVLTIPVWTIVCLIGTLGDASNVKYVTFATFGGVVLTFIVLKLIFMNHIGKEVYNPDTDPREAKLRQHGKTIGDDQTDFYESRGDAIEKNEHSAQNTVL